MNKNTNTDNSKVETPESLADQSLDGNLTARPKELPDIDDTVDESIAAGASIEAGEMNLEDAKESGYTDSQGRAVSMAKPDVEGSPTGAYTDIGAGRSSAVHRSSKRPTENRHH